MIIFRNYGMEVVIKKNDRYDGHILGVAYKDTYGTQYKGIGLDLDRAKLIRDALDEYLLNDGVIDGGEKDV